MSDTYDGEERRSDTKDLNFLLGTIVSRLTAIESNIDTKIGGVCEDLSEIKAADANKHGELEKRIYQRVLSEFQKISNKLDQISSWNSSVNLSVQKIDVRVDGLEKRIVALEDSGKNKVYEIWKKIGNKVLWVVLGIIGAAVLFAIAEPSFWLAILKK